MPPNDHQQRPSTCFENQKNAPINRISAAC
jgi:hypothetical protein